VIESPEQIELVQMGIMRPALVVDRVELAHDVGIERDGTNPGGLSTRYVLVRDVQGEQVELGDGDATGAGTL
jgi:hypothetical protein